MSSPTDPDLFGSLLHTPSPDFRAHPVSLKRPSRHVSSSVRPGTRQSHEVAWTCTKLPILVGRGRDGGRSAEDFGPGSPNDYPPTPLPTPRLTTQSLWIPLRRFPSAFGLVPGKSQDQSFGSDPGRSRVEVPTHGTWSVPPPPPLAGASSKREDLAVQGGVVAEPGVSPDAEGPLMPARRPSRRGPFLEQSQHDQVRPVPGGPREVLTVGSRVIWSAFVAW